MPRLPPFFLGLFSTLVAVGGGNRIITRYLYNQILAAGGDPQATNYPGIFGITKQSGLTEEERQVEARFAAELETNPPYHVGEYRRKWGHVLNTDNAREFSEDYRRSKENRARFSRAVHEPAGALVKFIWRKLLRQPVPQARNTVIFLAGGGGSGKTTAVEKLSEVKELWDSAHIVYDTTMAQEESSIHKVEEALANHKEVFIYYVHRPYDKAIRGMIKRAISTGRTVPSDQLAGDHYKAQRTFLSLCDKYEGHKNVKFRLISNRGNLDEIQVIKMDFRGFLGHDLYVDLVDMQAEVRRLVEHEYWTRKGTFQEIPDYVYRAIIGREPGSEGG